MIYNFWWNFDLFGEKLFFLVCVLKYPIFIKHLLYNKKIYKFMMSALSIRINNFLFCTKKQWPDYFPPKPDDSLFFFYFLYQIKICVCSCYCFCLACGLGDSCAVRNYLFFLLPIYFLGILFFLMQQISSWRLVEACTRARARLIVSMAPQEVLKRSAMIKTWATNRAPSAMSATSATMPGLWAVSRDNRVR